MPGHINVEQLEWLKQFPKHLQREHTDGNGDTWVEVCTGDPCNPAAWQLLAEPLVRNGWLAADMLPSQAVGILGPLKLGGGS